MVMIPCTICGGDGVVQQGRNCPACDGTKEVEAGLGMTEGHYMGMFNMIVELVATLADGLDKIDDVMDKCNDIFKKLNE